MPKGCCPWIMGWVKAKGEKILQELEIHSGKRWFLLGLIGSIFFLTTGGTFSSLGVLLPAMIDEIGWSWAQAGLGFSILAFFTGISSTLPAYTINWFGLRITYLIGGALIASGFLTLSFTTDLITYLLGAALIGLGYTQSGAVPAVKVLSNWFVRRRSLVIGVFFTCGALGSVCGPLVASYFLSNLESWRLYWMMIAAVTAGLTILTAMFVVQRPEQREQTDEVAADLKPAEESWPFREVLRSRQYQVITIAVTVTLFGALTMNTWQVTHMQNLGVAATVSATALSAHAVFNACSRITGGLIIDRVGAKLLFSIGLFAGVIGMAALAFATSPLLILLFAIGDGISFGIVTFASSILLLEYYGPTNNPMILGFLNLITTFAMIGPAMAGFLADKAGGFSVIFIGISILMLLVFILTMSMSKPVRTMPTQAAGDHEHQAA